MTPLDALAAAIRDRLVAGRPAPLPGLGTLVRQHVSARVEERADGTRVLLPPGETIGLADLGDEHEPLAGAFSRFQGLSEEQAEAAFDRAMDQMEARLAATGEARLPGVGLLRRTSGGVVLGVEADLLAAVNRTFEGLPPVPTAPAPETPPAQTEPADASEPDASEPDASEADVPELPLDDASNEYAWAENDASAEADEPPTGSAQTVGEDDLDEEHASEDDLLFDDALLDDGLRSSLDPSAFEDDELELSLPSEREPDDAPLRDLSSDGPAPPFLPLATPPGTNEDMELEDLPEDWSPPPVPTERVTDEDDTPSESALVDDDTLDDDLDDVLAVPFGTPPGESLSDVLPSSDETLPDEPVPTETPAPTDAASGTDDGDEDWLSDTWTAGAAGPPPPSFGEDAPEIEDAEIVEDAPDETELHIPDPTPDDEPVVIERIGPAEEFEQLFPPPLPASPPAVTEPTAVADEAPRPPSEPSDRRRGIPWWVPALVVLALVVALAVWLWPAPPAATDEVAQTPAAADGAPVEQTPDEGTPDANDALAAPSPADTPPPEADDAAPAANAPPDEAARPGQGLAPAPGLAILPPRLAGLDPQDARALSGDPIDPATGGRTFVVLSTPSRDEAEALSGRYRTAGYRTAVLEAPGSARRYRVAVGQFTSTDQARQLRDRLPPQAPPDTWVLDLRTL